MEADFDVDVLIPKDNTVGYFEASSVRGASGFPGSIIGEEEPPPPTGPSKSLSSSPSDGAGGICFITTAAYGSGLHPYMKALRSFRDSWLLFVGFVGFIGFIGFIGFVGFVGLKR